jgi:hypothetical protein
MNVMKSDVCARMIHSIENPLRPSSPPRLRTPDCAPPRCVYEKEWGEGGETKMSARLQVLKHDDKSAASVEFVAQKKR